MLQVLVMFCSKYHKTDGNQPFLSQIQLFNGLEISARTSIHVTEIRMEGFDEDLFSFITACSPAL
jgi:hypothetical protein